MTAPPFHPNCRCTTIPYFDDEFTVDEQRVMRNQDGNSVLADDLSYSEYRERYLNDRPQIVSAPPSIKSSTAKRTSTVRFKTADMASAEFNEYQNELERAKGLKQITLSKAEYANVMSELNTNLSDEDKKHAIVHKAIGNYVYIIVNRGFNNYTVVGREPIK